MKTVKQTMLIILGLLFFSLQGCSHDDYIPVPGAPGTNGINGIEYSSISELYGYINAYKYNTRSKPDLKYYSYSFAFTPETFGLLFSVKEPD